MSRKCTLTVSLPDRLMKWSTNTLSVQTLTCSVLSTPSTDQVNEVLLQAPKSIDHDKITANQPHLIGPAFFDNDGISNAVGDFMTVEICADEFSDDVVS